MTFSWTRRTQISTNNQIYIPIIDNLLYQLCYEIPCIVENTLYLQRFVNVWWYGHKLGTRHSSVYLFNKDSGSNSVGHGPKCWPLIWTSPPRGCLLFGKSRGQPFPNLFRNSLWLQLRQIITDGLISVKNNKKTSLNMFLFYLSSYKKKIFLLTRSWVKNTNTMWDTKVMKKCFGETLKKCTDRILLWIDENQLIRLKSLNPILPGQGSFLLLW